MKYYDWTQQKQNMSNLLIAAPKQQNTLTGAWQGALYAWPITSDFVFFGQKISSLQAPVKIQNRKNKATFAASFTVLEAANKDVIAIGSPQIGRVTLQKMFNY